MCRTARYKQPRPLPQAQRPIRRDELAAAMPAVSLDSLGPGTAESLLDFTRSVTSSPHVAAMAPHASGVNCAGAGWSGGQADVANGRRASTQQLPHQCRAEAEEVARRRSDEPRAGPSRGRARLFRSSTNPLWSCQTDATLNSARLWSRTKRPDQRATSGRRDGRMADTGRTPDRRIRYLAAHQAFHCPRCPS